MLTGCRLRLQPLARSRRDALARGRHPRRLGQLHLPARCRERRASGRPAISRAARTRQLRSHVRRGSGGIHPARRHPHHDPGGRRLAGGRCRGAPRVDRQYGPSGRARSRSPPMPSSCSRRPPPTRRIRPSRSCSSQTEYRCRGRAPSWRHAAGARPDEPEIWAAHLAVVEGEAIGELRVRDRSGPLPRPRPRHRQRRRRDRRATACPTPSARCSIRCSRCAGGCASRRRHGRASPSGPWSRRSREALLDLVDKHHDANAFERATTLAWTQAQVQLRHLGIEADRGEPLPAPGGPRPLRRSGAAAVVGRDPPRRWRPPPALWAHGISGDLPIVLVRIDDVEDIDIVRQLLRAHEYWRHEAAWPSIS